MGIQLDTSSLAHLYSSEALQHRIFFISQSLGTVGCVKNTYGFFLLYSSFVYLIAPKQCHVTKFRKFFI